jgi:hypothetical protein
MDFIYTKMDNMKYNGFELYYRTEINTNMHKAQFFNENYIYYYKYPNLENTKLLGKFLGKSKINTGSYNNDYDYEVYTFEHNNVFLDKADYIYCYGISNNMENMIPIEGLTFDNNQLYYKL